MKEIDNDRKTAEENAKEIKGMILELEELTQEKGIMKFFKQLIEFLLKILKPLLKVA